MRFADHHKKCTFLTGTKRYISRKKYAVYGASGERQPRTPNINDFNKLL